MESVIQVHRSSVPIAAGQDESCQIFHPPVSTVVLFVGLFSTGSFPCLNQSPALLTMLKLLGKDGDISQAENSSRNNSTLIQSLFFLSLQ